MSPFLIYKITICKTNKSYIGYSSLTIEDRFHKHYTNMLYGIKNKFY
ncbi:MAG: hypothetical protein RLZZ546_2341, partial [Bacteroidota bacterium]